MNLDQEREDFELAGVAHAIAQITAGQAIDDNGSGSTREALFWRKENGDYGVVQFNAAWWGWSRRALISSEIEQALSGQLGVVEEALRQVKAPPKPPSDEVLAHAAFAADHKERWPEGTTPPAWELCVGKLRWLAIARAVKEAIALGNTTS